jgi:hypothetical protein
MLSFLTWNIADTSTFVVIGDYITGFIVTEFLKLAPQKSRRNSPIASASRFSSVQISAGSHAYSACASTGQR